MARTVITQLVDDIDGSEAAETVRFALDGADYEIGLNKDNAARLRDGLAGFVSAARRSGGPHVTRTVLEPEQRVIRDWAAAQGISVNPRGRIPRAIVDRYMAAAS